MDVRRPQHVARSNNITPRHVTRRRPTSDRVPERRRRRRRRRRCRNALLTLRIHGVT